MDDSHNADVILFPGKTTLPIDADLVLESAKGKLAVTVILGWDKDGCLYVASSDPSRAEINWLLDLAKHEITKPLPDEETN
jgi:hypothetical protein